jgi:hypothetical protein
MYRRKVLLTASAVFAIGVAFAAQPISQGAGGLPGDSLQRTPWVPGANSPMSAHEMSVSVLTPPR